MSPAAVESEGLKPSGCATRSVRSRSASPGRHDGQQRRGGRHRRGSSGGRHTCRVLDDVLITPLDLLENFFGESPSEDAVMRMSPEAFEDLRDRVSEFGAAIAFSPAPEAATYCGGWLGGNWHQQIWRGDLSLSLLYYPRLLVHDPLAEYFFDDWKQIPEFRPLRAIDGSMSLSAGPEMWARQGTYDSFGGDIDAARHSLASLVRSLTAIAPLLRTGVVVTRPQWPVILKRMQSLTTSVRHDVRDQGMAWAVASAAAAGDPVPSWTQSGD